MATCSPPRRPQSGPYNAVEEVFQEENDRTQNHSTEQKDEGADEVPDAQSFIGVSEEVHLFAYSAQPELLPALKFTLPRQKTKVEIEKTLT
ncbi:unnamed protein product [Dibothriocephalus latus]|uniref:Uncharacterized protein n=1 Tax=Dibothriocephalus latus TaxID=60516 RepID=A0A3P7LIS4_DIBLA|nr:unnamed protein product [Dibothriocephalus latus]